MNDRSRRRPEGLEQAPPNGETDRRALIAAGAALGLTAWPTLTAAQPAAGPRLGAPTPFSFDRLIQRAKAMAARPYEAPPALDAATLNAIDFDAYGQITYDPKMTLWGGPGEPAVRLFAQGRMFRTPVRINVVDRGAARPVIYEPRLFDTPAGHPLRRLKGAGFSGFRVMNPDGDGDWLAFLGASYFRTAGSFNQYGASARGIAINAGGPATEEFPRFSEFWLERAPAGGLIAYALLDGPSVCGAYRIDSRLGAGGVAQTVEAALVFRRSVETLGLAPLTSMFWYGENSYGENGPRAKRDWRPEIHDSDGLALWTGAGERIWRPLIDPPRVVTNAFQDDDPKGFGLLQRDRAFDHYQDDGAFYDKRASVWIEPLQPFGPGSVRLVELPTDTETNDNIVAFWTPRQPVQAGAAMRTKYRIHWGADAPTPPLSATVVATRIGVGGRPGQPPRPGFRRIAVDFSGEGLKGLTRQSGVQGVVTASGGAVVDTVSAYPVVGASIWRLLFDIGEADKGPVEVRAYLRHAGAALSETWLYQLFPEK